MSIFQYRSFACTEYTLYVWLTIYDIGGHKIIHLWPFRKMPILNRRFSLLQKTLANLAWQRLSGPRCKIQKNRNTIYHKCVCQLKQVMCMENLNCKFVELMYYVTHCLNKNCFLYTCFWVANCLQDSYTNTLFKYIFARKIYVFSCLASKYKF